MDRVLVAFVHLNKNLSPTKVTPGNSIVNREDNLHDENDGQTQSKFTANPNKGTFYANLFTGGLSRKTMNFHTLFTPAGNRVDVVVSVESIRAISEQFANTVYGFCLGKHVNLLKEDVGNVPVWGKLYGVPVTAFNEDGLSVIATKLELKDNIVVTMPKLVGEGFYTCNVRVEYEWKPPRCACCKVFGHVQEECLKNIDLDVASKKNNVNTSSNKKKDAEPIIEGMQKEILVTGPMPSETISQNVVKVGNFIQRFVVLVWRERIH
ncbi:hypothetical protein Tco_0892355 [Tanacetum coccineum]|uniref:DUF4283 domain-containing protein n=1 Tax=Tanacetum coccineum TaxID=301880 RepID=A0ABQ5C718_9ASTR